KSSPSTWRSEARSWVCVITTRHLCRRLKLQNKPAKKSAYPVHTVCSIPPPLMPFPRAATSRHISARTIRGTTLPRLSAGTSWGTETVKAQEKCDVHLHRHIIASSSAPSPAQASRYFPVSCTHGPPTTSSNV
ncbi:unnamed protein product, partial [Sphacelaria rigidula]